MRPLVLLKNSKLVSNSLLYALVEYAIDVDGISIQYINNGTVEWSFRIHGPDSRHGTSWVDGNAHSQINRINSAVSDVLTEKKPSTNMFLVSINRSRIISKFLLSLVLKATQWLFQVVFSSFQSWLAMFGMFTLICLVILTKVKRNGVNTMFMQRYPENIKMQKFTPHMKPGISWTNL